MAGVGSRLFRPGEVVASDRLRLSALDADSLVSMRPWVEAALAPEWRFEDLEAALANSEAVLIADGLDNAVGLAILRLDEPSKEDAVIAFLTMDPERRYRGLGGEAGLALERHARARLGLRRFYVGVPEGRGLGVYFWLRLGYRPLSAAEAPEMPLGLTLESRPGIWMVRGAA